jgi:hypothetical protein
MRSALVVYESMFGDAHTIANAIAAGLSTTMSVAVVDAREAPGRLDPDLALLVVGAPNHQFGLPRPRTRKQAERSIDAKFPTTHDGLREWLHRVRPGGGVPAAVFDLRLTHPGFLRHLDHASGQEEHLLTERGCSVLAPAEHFAVLDTAGPLADGEVARATAWGATLAGLLDRPPQAGDVGATTVLRTDVSSAP